MSDRLTPLDATFLELEEAADAAHMHIGSLMIFEARTARPPTLARLRRPIEGRLGALPRACPRPAARRNCASGPQPTGRSAWTAPARCGTPVW